MFPIAMLGTPELLVVLLVILLLFGVKKLPEMGRSLAEGIREFKKASRETSEYTEQSESSNYMREK